MELESIAQGTKEISVRNGGVRSFSAHRSFIPFWQDISGNLQIP